MQKLLQYCMHFWKTATYIIDWLMHWEGGRIYNSTQAFWWLFPRGFYSSGFFFFLSLSDPLTASFCHRWSSWHSLGHQLNSKTALDVCRPYVCIYVCPSSNNACTFLCVFHEQKAFLWPALHMADLIQRDSGKSQHHMCVCVCVSEDGAKRKWETHKSHLI